MEKIRIRHYITSLRTDPGNEGCIKYEWIQPIQPCHQIRWLSVQRRPLGKVSVLPLLFLPPILAERGRVSCNMKPQKGRPSCYLPRSDQLIRLTGKNIWKADKLMQRARQTQPTLSGTALLSNCRSNCGFFYTSFCNVYQYNVSAMMKQSGSMLL